MHESHALGVFPGDAELGADDGADFGYEVGGSRLGDVGDVAADVVGIGRTEKCRGDSRIVYGILHREFFVIT